MSSWKEYSFGELVDFPPKIHLRKGDEYPFIDMDVVKPENRYVRNLQLKKYDSSGSAKFSNRDVLLARITPCLENGKIAQVKLTESQHGFGSTEFFVLRSKKNLLNQGFLFYLAKSDLIWKNAVNSMVGASGRQRADATFLKKVKLVIPQLKEQEKIAAILSAYDDLIENNKRRITMLEIMAEEIYREWFVRLRFPGHEKVKVLKGVPEGWSAVQFSEICTFQKGKTPEQNSSEAQDGFLPYLTMEYLENKNTEYVLNKKNSVVCEDGDILMLMDGARSGLVFRAKDGIVGSTLARVKTKAIYRDVIYEYLKATREHIVSNNTGSAIPHANKEFIHRMMMILPKNENLIDKFNSIYRGFFEQSQNLLRQNEFLIRSRNLLLPRLISGKLSVEHLDIQFPLSMNEGVLD